MTRWFAFLVALFPLAASGSAYAQCAGCAVEWSNGAVTNLTPPGSFGGEAFSINNAGQIAGTNDGGPVVWSNGNITSLGLGGGGSSTPFDINDAGQIAGYRFVGNVTVATEWSNGNVINLGGLPGSVDSFASGINNSGQIAGDSQYIVNNNGFTIAAEWINGAVINLGGLLGFTDSGASGINNAGQVVGGSIVDGVDYATEWSNGSIINLGPGVASSINNNGQAVGSNNGFAAEYSNGQVINLGALPGSFGSVAYSINDAGVAVGLSWIIVDGGVEPLATEWDDGTIINLGGLPGYTDSLAWSINDAGQVVGSSQTIAPPPIPVPEPSTWAMMIVGFAGLTLAGCRWGACSLIRLVQLIPPLARRYTLCNMKSVASVIGRWDRHTRPSIPTITSQKDWACLRVA